MKAHIIQIGNSKGIRIPKAFLDESGIKSDIELEICDEGILIRSTNKPRSSWDDVFRSLKDTDDEHEFARPVETVFEKSEWQW